MFHASCLITVGFLSTAVSSVAAGPVTPTQWASNGHWYRPVVTPEFVLWTEANVIAQDMGGYLVSITSVEENDFVFSLIDASCYWQVGGSNDQIYMGPWTGGALDDPSTGSIR